MMRRSDQADPAGFSPLASDTVEQKVMFWRVGLDGFVSIMVRTCRLYRRIWRERFS